MLVFVVAEDFRGCEWDVVWVVWVVVSGEETGGVDWVIAAAAVGGSGASGADRDVYDGCGFGWSFQVSGLGRRARLREGRLL